jgi:hypothetical protein
MCSRFATLRNFIRDNPLTRIWITAAPVVAFIVRLAVVAGCVAIFDQGAQ